MRNTIGIVFGINLVDNRRKIWSSRWGTTELGGNLLNYTPRGSRLILTRAERNTLAGCRGYGGIEVGRKLLSSTLHYLDCEALEFYSRFSKFRRLRRFRNVFKFLEVLKIRLLKFELLGDIEVLGLTGNWCSFARLLQSFGVRFKILEVSRISKRVKISKFQKFEVSKFFVANSEILGFPEIRKFRSSKCPETLEVAEFQSCKVAKFPKFRGFQVAKLQGSKL